MKYFATVLVIVAVVQTGLVAPCLCAAVEQDVATDHPCCATPAEPTPANHCSVVPCTDSAGHLPCDCAAHLAARDQVDRIATMPAVPMDSSPAVVRTISCVAAIEPCTSAMIYQAALPITSATHIEHCVFLC